MITESLILFLSEFFLTPLNLIYLPGLPEEFIDVFDTMLTYLADGVAILACYVDVVLLLKLLGLIVAGEIFTFIWLIAVRVIKILPVPME